MGEEQVKARYITIWPGMSLTSLWLEVGATDSPLELHKIEVQWAGEARDPNPEIFTEENCAEITRDLKPRCERDVPDQLVVYYWEIEDDQSGENDDAKADGPEAMCQEFQSLGFDQTKWLGKRMEHKSCI